MCLLQGKLEGVFGYETFSGGPQGPGSPAGVEAMGIEAGRGADGHGGHEAPATIAGSEPGVDHVVCGGPRLLQSSTSTMTTPSIGCTCNLDPKAASTPS